MPGIRNIPHNITLAVKAYISILTSACGFSFSIFCTAAVAFVIFLQPMTTLAPYIARQRHVSKPTNIIKVICLQNYFTYE